MNRAFVIAIAAATVASCGGSGRIAVRALPTPLASGERSVSFRIAEANGQFALGNVALALESYRKALRENISSVDAMVGMAACYDAMGRFDLSRRHYEAALAVEPANRDLLGRLAASLLQQGLAGEAASIRQEIAARSRTAPPSSPPPTAVADNTVLAPVGASITIPMPVARQVSPITVALVAAAAPVERAARPSTGPRLERLSLGEVALVTTGIAPASLTPRTAVSTLAPPRTAASTNAPPRMAVSALASPKVMLASLRSGSSPLLLLNAARSQGLASRTRRYLTGHGFGDAVLGDAPRVRATTVIIAPARDRQRAQRLARAFGIRARVIDGRRLTMILGRDSAARRILAS